MPRTRRHRARRATPRSSSTTDGEFRVFGIEIPEDIEDAARRGGARGAHHGARAARGGDGRAPAHAHHRRRPRARLVAGAAESDPAHGRDAGQLRPHRRADREAGHPAADPRGRARDHVRGVRRPAGRGRDGHRPAGGRPQQRPRRPRSRRVAAPALRAGRRRALRAGKPDQGRHRARFARARRARR